MIAESRRADSLLDHWAMQLRLRGMTEDQVKKLCAMADSERGVSMHELLELLDAGCPVETAFDIAS